MKDPRLLQTQAAPPDVEVDTADADTIACSSSGSNPQLASVSRPSFAGKVAWEGQVLDGRYVLERQLGEGGMGVVYGGRHKVIGKRVAIKILRADLAADEEMTDRFLTEARAASSIGNPHIVDISDFGRIPDGTAYFVMEFLEGKSLADLMRELRVIAVPRIVHIAKQIAKGLAAAHARGIVHRDLKPENVMLVERGDDHDFVKILDFGIAKVSTEGARQTKAGSVFGTPHYMSPEQAAGVPVDKRTDIYALGVILYEMAAGKVPFDADNFMGILTQHMYKAPVPIRALVPQPQEVPPSLEAIVLKALSKKVELRYQTMEELVADLEKVERGQVPDAVAEMMARSGGFNVPADYFRNPPRANPGGPAMVAASPQLAPPRSSKLVGVLIGTVILLGVVGAIFAVASWKSKANADVPPPAVTTPVAQDPSIPAAPKVTEVLLVVDEKDARLYNATTNDEIGRTPQTVAIKAGERVSVRIEAKGFVTKTVEVDGSTKRQDIVLEKVPQPAVAGGPIRRPVPTTTGKLATVPPAPATPPKASAAPAPTTPTCPPGWKLDPWGKCEKPLL